MHCPDYIAGPVCKHQTIPVKAITVAPISHRSSTEQNLPVFIKNNIFQPAE